MDVKTQISTDNYTTVCNHPLCLHNLSIIRDKNTSAEVFRNAIKRLTYLLFYTATKDLPTENISIDTPLCTTNCDRLREDTKIVIAPILRAGLIFSDIASEIIPNVKHIVDFFSISMRNPPFL